MHHMERVFQGCVEILMYDIYDRYLLNIKNIVFSFRWLEIGELWSPRVKKILLIVWLNCMESKSN